MRILVLPFVFATFVLLSGCDDSDKVKQLEQDKANLSSENSSLRGQLGEMTAERDHLRLQVGILQVRKDAIASVTIKIVLDCVPTDASANPPVAPHSIASAITLSRLDGSSWRFIDDQNNSISLNAASGGNYELTLVYVPEDVNSVVGHPIDEFSSVTELGLHYQGILQQMNLILNSIKQFTVLINGISVIDAHDLAVAPADSFNGYSKVDVAQYFARVEPNYSKGLRTIDRR